jgi:hypothetical protein
MQKMAVFIMIFEQQKLFYPAPLLAADSLVYNRAFVSLLLKCFSSALVGATL